MSGKAHSLRLQAYCDVQQSDIRRRSVSLVGAFVDSFRQPRASGSSPLAEMHRSLLLVLQKGSGPSREASIAHFEVLATERSPDLEAQVLVVAAGRLATWVSGNLHFAAARVQLLHAGGQWTLRFASTERSG